MRQIRALIIGAGIGGCTLSLALRRLNQQAERTRVLFSSTIFEQAPKIQPVGAGIALGPNGLSILESLGLYPKVQVFGGEVNTLQIFKDDGQKLKDFDLSFINKKHGYPLLVLERAELQALMVHEVMGSTVRSWDAEHTREILFGKRCIGAEDLGPNKGVRAHFADGTSEDGDVLLAADGLKSTIRQQIIQQTEPTESNVKSAAYSGISCVLGVTSSVPETIQGSVYWVLGPGRIYGTWSMGRQKQYWFLAEKEDIQPPSPANRAVGSESLWSDDAALKGMDRMWNWFHPYDHHAMFNRTVRMVKIGMFETPWTGAWSKGNVGLVGDAAHAMLPTVNQGANMAIEDAAAVARALAYGSSNISESLHRYEEFRKKRTTKMMRLARTVGSLQASGSDMVTGLNEMLMRFAPQSAFENSMDWIMQYQDKL